MTKFNDKSFTVGPTSKEARKAYLANYDKVFGEKNKIEWMDDVEWKQWKEDCIANYGKVLTGKKSHWCCDWDGLPVDETMEEEMSVCTCFHQK